MPAKCLALIALAATLAAPTRLPADWQVHHPHDQRESSPPAVADSQPVKPGDPWPGDAKFRWLRGTLELPEAIEGKPVAGECVGLRFNCGDGGEVWVGGLLITRYDNDHPALVLLTTNAVPGAKFAVDVQVYGKIQGGDRFDEAALTLVDRSRACESLTVVVDPGNQTGPVPEGLIGLSQGGGMADHDDATAAKLKEGRFRWFRMDNVFTPVVKADTNGVLDYDWTDFDRRLDFIAKVGAEAILAASYMPQPLDAVPNHERQSAPKDYGAWEELCFRAAQRAVQRGKRVAFWEVWNEVNTGWLKPGPQDTGGEEFTRLYAAALGAPATNREVVRRFEAYCKLYRATANGVRRADPGAKVGGPALASGPFESAQRGHCANGRGFARGLMLWCQQERLPLDFVSWHEYFHPAEVFAKEAEEFRASLAKVPELEKSVQSLMITEWNEAWWADRPQDHEIGASWAADCVTRAFIPQRIDRPCYFYAKQGDQNFRGDYSLLLRDNTPKAAFHVCRIFNELSGRWLQVEGGDDEVSCVAAWDAAKRRLAVVLVNFNYRHSLARPVRLALPGLPESLRQGKWRVWLVDATHSNAWNDPHAAELAQVGVGAVSGSGLELARVLPPNSVTLVEVVKP